MDLDDRELKEEVGVGVLDTALNRDLAARSRIAGCRARLELFITARTCLLYTSDAADE